MSDDSDYQAAFTAYGLLPRTRAVIANKTEWYRWAAQQRTDRREPPPLCRWCERAVGADVFAVDGVAAYDSRGIEAVYAEHHFCDRVLTAGRRSRARWLGTEFDPLPPPSALDDGRALWTYRQVREHLGIDDSRAVLLALRRGAVSVWLTDPVPTIGSGEAAVYFAPRASAFAAYAAGLQAAHAAAMIARSG